MLPVEHEKWSMKEVIMSILRIGHRIGYGLIWTSLLILLKGCIDVDSQTPSPSTVTPGVETTQPMQSPPVAPSQSQELQSLPTLPPYQTGTPVYEINPRVRPNIPDTPTLPNAPTPTESNE